MAEPFVKKTYYALTLDPVHVGTGGYRLGRVDNTITREPGTNLPKVPGSSISGVTRAYTAMAVQNVVDMTKLVYKTKNGLLAIDTSEYKKMKYLRPKYINNDGADPDKPSNKLVKSIDLQNPEIAKAKDGKEIYYSCAGKGAEEGEGHCGRPDCEVCIPFGFSKGKSGSSFQGLAQFFDARILFFPVHSMIGPVWVTSPCILSEHGLSLALSDDNFKSFGLNVGNKLNLGWLMLPKADGADLNLPAVLNDIPDEIRNRLLLVSDKLFSRIVNDNLEVRTSVAIDPATGAAEDGALFTYEAIPRATVMWFDIVYNKPEYFRINGTEAIIHGKTNGKGWEWIRDNIEKGLNYFESLGVGGMGTRGMGRMRVLNLGGQ